VRDIPTIAWILAGAALVAFVLWFGNRLGR